ncbi:hypothetical protein KPL74_07230 [Bacillus sp. NP157]|nr:hypothetical protein KPL74_07230 [Bacillus sp. NP157]
MKIVKVCVALALVASGAAMASTQVSGDVTRTLRDADARKVRPEVIRRFDAYAAEGWAGSKDKPISEGVAPLKSGTAQQFIYQTHSRLDGTSMTQVESQRISQWCVARDNGRVATYRIEEDLQPKGSVFGDGWKLMSVQMRLRDACPSEVVSTDPRDAVASDS